MLFLGRLWIDQLFHQDYAWTSEVKKALLLLLMSYGVDHLALVIYLVCEKVKSLLEWS
jgi:hypothetical protein